MTSSDLESRSRSPICELGLCLVVSNLHTKFEEPSFIIYGDIVRKPKCDSQTDGRTDGQTDGRTDATHYHSSRHFVGRELKKG